MSRRSLSSFSNSKKHSKDGSPLNIRIIPLNDVAHFEEHRPSWVSSLNDDERSVSISGTSLSEEDVEGSGSGSLRIVQAEHREFDRLGRTLVVPLNDDDQSISITGPLHSDDDSISLTMGTPAQDNIGCSYSQDGDDESWDVEQGTEELSKKKEDVISLDDSTSDPVIMKKSRSINTLKYFSLATNIVMLGVALYAIFAPSSHFLVLALAIIFVFLAQTVVFALRESLMADRRSRMIERAAKASAIVNSLFPTVVRDRVVGASRQEEDVRGTARNNSGGSAHPRFFPVTAKRQLEKYLTTAGNNNNNNNNNNASTSPTVTSTLFVDEPIAETFHNTTIMFADISGFTAWSSERAPPQVFRLLETLYQDFDQVARRLGVFKVETIGDCYVAVAGLPEKREDHAIVMAQFAFACQKRMGYLAKTLEVALGPGTSDLSLRIGLHSGSVTAGVLRGEKSRFQIFGDVMNVASRMESTGIPGRIQASQDTADLISQGGKSHWLREREDPVCAKGKGMLTTFFVKPRKKMKSSARGTSSIRSSQSLNVTQGSLTEEHWGTLSFSNGCLPSGILLSDKEDRLVDWCTDLLSEFLAKVLASRRTRPLDSLRKSYSNSEIKLDGSTSGDSIMSFVDADVKLPEFDRKKMAAAQKREATALSDDVRMLLREFVAEVAATYHDHPFHNFEHASHVLLSANKLMKRIVSPDSVDTTLNPDDIDWEDMHNSSFGISSDPLTQFTIVFSALIHDVDHKGVPNAVLVQEHSELAVKYRYKSVAEQNSVDIALRMLSEPRFQALQSAICATPVEKLRFRQILINSILATDILDEDLKQLRQQRWSDAFDSSESSDKNNNNNNNMARKATVVIEHIIQASDVSHTMQHWHVFRKWNEKLFIENYHAYQVRGGRDPSEDWYEQEIHFFDKYVIPLAMNLKECGVFGVSSDEYLNYALANRDEWILKGKTISQDLHKRAISQYQKDASNTMAGRAA